MFMSINDLFTVLYPVVPLVGLIGYAPQLLALIKTKRSPESISLSTWYLWTTTWLISLGYAGLVIGDLMLSVTAAMNVAGHAGVIWLTLYKRAIHTEEPVFSLAPIFSDLQNQYADRP